MRPELSSKLATDAPASPAGAASQPRAKDSHESFRDSLARRAGPRERPRGKGPASPDEASGLLARPDGTLVVTASLSGPEGLRGKSRTCAEPATRALASRALPARHVALTDVKIGGTSDAVHLHARLGEGRHAGVELRAVDRDGKVCIELVAADAQAEKALRGELAQVRESLRLRGMESVSVDVRSGDDDPRRDRRDAPEQDDAVSVETRTEARRDTGTDEAEIVL